jgi:hypothetical protein
MAAAASAGMLLLEDSVLDDVTGHSFESHTSMKVRSRFSRHDSFKNSISDCLEPISNVSVGCS